MFSKKHLGLIALVLVSGAASAAGTGVEGAASQFQADFISGASAIGGAMLTAGFAAIVWKWLKAAIFG